MYDLDDDLKQKIKDINSSLRKTYSPYNEKSREFKRDFINQYIGNLIEIDKMSDNHLSKYNNIIGVDGSTNRLGGAYPHYIELFQALAKSTNNKYDDVVINDVYTPILDVNTVDNEEIIDRKRQLLAAVELDAAIAGAKNNKPDIIMMDGGLVRYKIDDKSRYTELREICEERNIILVGVIKDVKTSMISIS
ncbi:MAG: DNA double-strand break repair nuclease NurA [Tissierellia bacterium]|nr:DNA double-strand break repair nuclease NurA [Tissierellia bacterium]